MVDAIKPLYTAHGTAVGGRNGHTRSDDGMVDVNLSVPKEMGGPGKPGTATPRTPNIIASGATDFWPIGTTGKWPACSAGQ